MSSALASAPPKISFIVLSYNYENLIGITLDSILAQTFGDFEVVVVDDASTDRSGEVIRNYRDERIRLLVNERNLGGAASYNRAIENARGEFLVNLDADDWITPEKTAIQLARMEADPTLDILGTHVSIVDATGARHAHADEWEPLINSPRDLNEVDSWIIRNPLCRSSTMVRRSAHTRIGLDDPTMVRAPDYELWTRALRMGCRFGIVPEPLTYYRVQARGVTHADPLGTFLELSYCLSKNLIPLIEARAAYPSLSDGLRWAASNEHMADLRPASRYTLMAFLLRAQPFGDFRVFKEAILDGSEPELILEGRRLFATIVLGREHAMIEKLQSDIVKYIEARDYWHGESEFWKAAAAQAASAPHAMTEVEPATTAQNGRTPLWQGLRGLRRR